MVVAAAPDSSRSNLLSLKTYSRAGKEMLGIFHKKRQKTSGVGLAPAYSISPWGRTSRHPDGVVFLHLETGILFKANQVGARIWEGVLNQDSPETIASRISREYSVPASQVAVDTAGFLADLEA